MQFIDVERMDNEVFAQVAEQVVRPEPMDIPYEREFTEQVYRRIAKCGPIVGRSSVIRAVHDGEVGVQFIMTPRTEDEVIREVHDPLLHGV